MNEAEARAEHIDPARRQNALGAPSMCADIQNIRITY